MMIKFGYILGCFGLSIILVCAYFLYNPEKLSHGVKYRIRKSEVTQNTTIYYEFWKNGKYKGRTTILLPYYYTKKEKDSSDRIAEKLYREATKTYTYTLDQER